MKAIWRRLKKSKTGLVGLIIVSFFVLMALFAPLIATHDPLKADIMRTLEGPSLRSPLGRDALGRDIYSRIVYGSRLSLLASFGAVAIGVLSAVPLGLMAGYFGGKVDTVIRSLADLMLAFPPFLLALSLVAVLGVGLRNVLISVGISTIPVYIRLVRGEVLSLREQEYVLAAKALGRSDLSIIFRHILRNVFPLIIVQSTIYMGITLLYSAGLGFLGLGVQPPTPEWGSMVGAGRTYIYSAIHLSIFPGLAIFLAILGFNLLGDGLRDALDPRLRGQ
jgi:ABC-type dipeptide/oligopeptide/nickel transport system permease subunit